MPKSKGRAACWRHIRDRNVVGFEHVVVSDESADSALIAVSEKEVPFRLNYQLGWDPEWRLRRADLLTTSHGSDRSLGLRSDGAGHWQLGNGRPVPALAGCLDIDIWPTPFTNTFPIRRLRLRVGERKELRVAWVLAPDLTVTAVRQAYTRLDRRTFMFESLDNSGFKSTLDVDAKGVVLDYPGLFKRVPRLRKSSRQMG